MQSSTDANRAILLSLVLLTVALIVCGAGVVILWLSAFAAPGDLMFAPNWEFDKHDAQFRELVRQTLGVGAFKGDDIKWTRPPDFEAKIAEIVASARGGNQDPFDPDPVGTLRRALAELTQRQNAEIRGWRLKQALIVGLPLVLVGIGIAWLGLRTMRRARMANSVSGVDGVRLSDER